MKCCVPGCDGDVTGSGGHPFPSGAVMRYKWQRAIQVRMAAPNHHDTASSSFAPSGGAKVCEEHFKPEDFETAPDGDEKKRVLKIDAVPSLFPPKRRTKTGSVGSLINERLRFRQRTQGPEEAIESYMQGLQVHKWSQLLHVHSHIRMI